MRVTQKSSHGRPYRCDAPILGDDRQREAPAHVRRALADAVEECEVLGEASERDVLAVVGRGFRIPVARGQRLHGAAERRARLVHGHLCARVDEVEPSGQPGETAADHRHLHRTSSRATTASFAGVESRHDSSKTSKPFASMRSS